MIVVAPRFFALSWLALLGILFGSFLPGLGAGAGGLLVLLAGLALLETRALPRAASLEVERQVGDRLTFGQSSAVRIRLRNLGRRPLNLQLADSPDQELGPLPEHSQFEVHLNGRQSTALEYRLQPEQRGNFWLGPLRVRVGGPLGLVQRQFEIPMQQKVRIYPRCGTAATLVQQKVLEQSGSRRFRLPGQGTEFDHLRDYTRDDDVRRIDWKATARGQRPMVRSYQAERHQSIMLVLDAGRLLVARAGSRPKFEWCLEAACGLAQVALRRGDHVGVLVYAQRVLAFLPARAGIGQLQAILDSVYSLGVQRCESLHSKAVAQLRQYQRKRALLACFTDLGDPTSAGRLQASLLPLRPTHLPLVLTIRDQQIWDLAAAIPRNEPEMYRVAVANELLAEREQTLLALRRGGALTVDCPAQDLSLRAVQTYLDIKQRNQL